MPEITPNTLPSGEVSLPQIFDEVRRFFWRILGVTILVGMVTACYLLTIPNTFESKAGLIIRTPEVELTGEAAPLSPEMLIALTESQEVKKAAYDVLSASGVIDPDFKFITFQRSLATVVERKSGVVRDLLPMVHLTARASDPELASQMANQWVQSVLQRTKEIYIEGVGELGKFIGDVSEKADDSRNKAEVELATQTLNADVEINKQKLGKQTEQCIAFETEILTLTSTLQSNLKLIDELKERVTEQEKEGVWVGELMEAAYRLGEEIQNGSPSSDDIIGRISRRVRDYVDRQRELKEFTKKSGYDALKLEYDGYSKELSLVLADLASASREIVVTEKRFMVLEKLVNQIPQKITYNKAITDDALWNAYLKGGADLGKASSTLKTEEGNPLYQEVGKLHADAMVSVETATQKLLAYHVRRKDLVRLIAELREKMDLIDQQIEAKEEGITRSKAMLDILKGNYDADRKQLSEIRLKVQRDQFLLKIKKDILKGFDDERKELAESVSANEVMIAGLAREVTKMSGIANSLASKAVEIQLSNVSAQQASRSGVQILYHAEANPQKVGPGRMRIMVMVMFLVFAAGLFVTATRPFLGEALSKNT